MKNLLPVKRQVITRDYRSVTERPRFVVDLPGQFAHGRYKVQVVSPSGKVVEDRPWAKNLILDQGLNSIATRSWQASFTYCAAGIGNEPTQYLSSAVPCTLSQSGTTVTASAGFFAAIDGVRSVVGMVIRWAGGELATITAYIGDTSVTVSSSATVSSANATVYAVTQTGLDDEVLDTVGRPISRSTSYLTTPGSCGTSIVSNTLTMKRTYEFAPEESSKSYAELGFSWSQSNGSNLFSRVLISGGTVTVAEEFQLRVIYELAITLTPVTPTSRTASITGWLNRVASTTITNAGSGGTPGTYDLGVVGGDGTAFAGTYTIGGGGTLASIAITNYGYGYTVAPTLSFPSGSIAGGVAATANLDAWTQGDEMIQGWGIERVEATGAGSYGSGGNEPSSEGVTHVSEDSEAFETAGVSDDRDVLDSVTNTLGSYTTNTFTRQKTGAFGVLAAIPVGAGIRAIMLAGPGGGGNDSERCFTYLFDNPQEKLNTHKLEVTWQHTWGRSF